MSAAFDRSMVHAAVGSANLRSNTNFLIHRLKSTADKPISIGMAQSATSIHKIPSSAANRNAGLRVLPSIPPYGADDEILRQDDLARKTSKTADNTLKKTKKPVVAVIDEACQSTELGTLLVWAHNTETSLLLVFLGDPKQL